MLTFCWSLLKAFPKGELVGLVLCIDVFRFTVCHTNSTSSYWWVLRVCWQRLYWQLTHVLMYKHLWHCQLFVDTSTTSSQQGNGSFGHFNDTSLVGNQPRVGHRLSQFSTCSMSNFIKDLHYNHFSNFCPILQFLHLFTSVINIHDTQVHDLCIYTVTKLTFDRIWMLFTLLLRIR